MGGDDIMLAGIKKALDREKDWTRLADGYYGYCEYCH